MRRRQFIASVLFFAFAGSAEADVSEWFKSDLDKFYDIIEAFPEYDELGDLDNANRMLAMFKNIHANPKADKILTEHQRRLPQYRNTSRTQLVKEMIRLFDAVRSDLFLSTLGE